MTETITENARVTKVVGHYDLCVAGGGPAGFATALTAARNGKKVCLLENAGCLGGIWTAGQLTWFIDYKNKTGLIQEIISKMEARGARGANPDGTPNAAFDVEALKDLLDTMAIEAGIEVHLYSRVAAAITEDRIVKYAVAESKSGRRAFEAERFADCTGDGDLGALAGNGFDFGSPIDGSTQPMSMTAMVTGIRLQDVKDFLRPTNATTPWAPPKERLRAVMESGGASPSYHFPTLMPVSEDLFLLQTNHEYGFKAYSEEDLTKATIHGRHELNQLVAALRRAGGIWKDIRLVATPAFIGVREGRRLHGKYTLTRQDLIDGKTFEDAVCHPTAGFDVHSTDPLKNKGIASQPVYAKPYDIPLRSLMAADFDNLFMAGRCISGDFYAHSSYRMTGNAVTMGESLGKYLASL